MENEHESAASASPCGGKLFSSGATRRTRLGWFFVAEVDDQLVLRAPSFPTRTRTPGRPCIVNTAAAVGRPSVSLLLLPRAYVSGMGRDLRLRTASMECRWNVLARTTLEEKTVPATRHRVVNPVWLASCDPLCRSAAV
ncbi:hypothetical protein MRX96_008278 [Rhipicephalus microplus]